MASTPAENRKARARSRSLSLSLRLSAILLRGARVRALALAGPDAAARAACVSRRGPAGGRPRRVDAPLGGQAL